MIMLPISYYLGFKAKMGLGFKGIWLGADLGYVIMGLAFAFYMYFMVNWKVLSEKVSK